MKAKQIQEIIGDMGSILNMVNLVLKDHEKRLRLVEELDLENELEQLACRIMTISDPEKKAQGLAAFKNMCDLLGITKVESNKS